jgi:hypothetical protein
MLIELTSVKNYSILINSAHVISMEPYGKITKVLMIDSLEYFVIESVGEIVREIADMAPILQQQVAYED